MDVVELIDFVITLAFSGCAKTKDPIIPDPPKDTTPPEISIATPPEQKVYVTNTVPFNWTIVEENFKSAWYSVDNEKTKVPIAKTGAENLTLPNGNGVNRTCASYSGDCNNRNASIYQLHHHVLQQMVMHAILTVNCFMVC